MSLKKTWDLHAKEDAMKRYSYNPNMADIVKSKEFHTQWMLKISRTKKSAKFLDAGCGIGHFVTLARFLGFKAEGIDISEEAVKIGKSRGEKITLGDLRKMPFKSGTWDIVLAEGSIEHFPETERAIREIARVLKKKGIFIGNVPNRFSIFVVSKLIQQMLGAWKCGYEKSFTKKRLVYLLKKNGFRIIEMKKSRVAIGKHPFFSKPLRAIDDFLNIFGLGGPHHYFYCIK